MSKTRVGFAMTGSFCTFAKVFEQVQRLVDMGYDVTPVLSSHVAVADTRFYTAQEVRDTLERITGRKPLVSITEVEPIGPKKLLDVYVVAPATGTSLSKIAAGIFDTPALLGVKSHLRNNRPVLLAPSTNDGLGTAAVAIGRLLGMRNIYFVPFSQDDPVQKPRSLVSRFELIPEALAAALAGAQVQPILSPNA